MPTIHIPSQVKSSQEFQSAVIRLSIWLFMLVMIGSLGLIKDYDFVWGYFIFGFAVHFVWYVGILISTVRHPQLWRGRTYLGILADLSGTTATLYLTGDATGPFYLLFAVSFLSQGMRYGKTNLLLASVGSLLAFTLVAAVLGDWRTQPLEVLFVSLVLVVLPAYEFVLLRKLQTAKDSAETAKRARGNFLATMTHELRTPLSGMIGMAGLLKRTRLDDEQREYLDSIDTSAGVLQGLIGDVLDLSKIDAGKLQLKPASFAVRESLNQTCWMLSNQALEKGVELICRVSPDVPEKVFGDELRFRQILFNLIGNAVKFTEHGYICVHARVMCADRDQTAPYLEVAIIDSGIGIAADRIGQVFESFWQADPSSTRRYGGSGLGTAIARDLTRLMGGTIEVRSEEGRGSTFRVKLPLLGGDASAPPRAPTVLRGARALVFEQNEQSAQAIVEICKAAGMITEVISSIDQLGALQGDDPKKAAERRLVLVVDTPRGLDLGRVGSLVHRLLGPGTPVVYLHYPRRKPAISDQSAAWALKPVNAVNLWQAMAGLVAPGGETDAGIATALQEPVPEGSTAGRVLVAEDDNINAKLIASLLHKAGCDVTLVRDGRAALGAACTKSFELAFIDLRMPHMDGIDFTRAYRARELAGQHLPIVAITANAAEDARAECLRAGMDEFVTKPVDPDILRELLLRYGLTAEA